MSVLPLLHGAITTVHIPLLLLRRKLTSGDALDFVMAPPGCSIVVTGHDLVCMFEEEVNNQGQACYVTPTSLMLAMAVLKRHIKCRDVPVLVGDLLHFRPTFKVDYSAERRAGALERLLGAEAVTGLGPGEYLDVIFSKYKTILLPYNVKQDFLVFEVVLQSDRGRMVKVWDGAQVWVRGDPRTREEIKTIVDVFFGGDSGVPVYVWEKGDAAFGTSRGAGAFTFLTMCYRALGLKPQEWEPCDEGVARSFLWGCILHGTIVQIPKLKMM